MACRAIVRRRLARRARARPATSRACVNAAASAFALYVPSSDGPPAACTSASGRARRVRLARVRTAVLRLLDDEPILVDLGSGDAGELAEACASRARQTHHSPRRLATMRGTTRTPSTRVGSPASARPTISPAAVPPLPSGTTSVSGAAGRRARELVRQLDGGIRVAQRAERAAAPRGNPSHSRSARQPRERRAKHRRHRRSARRHRATIAQAGARRARYVVLLLRPGEDPRARAELRAEECDGQRVRRSARADREQHVARRDAGEQQLERARLVPPERRRREIVALRQERDTTELPPLDRRLAHLQIHARERLREPRPARDEGVHAQGVAAPPLEHLVQIGVERRPASPVSTAGAARAAR